MRRRVGAVAVLHRGPAEEAPWRLRREAHQGDPARGHRAQGLGLPQERQPQRIEGREAREDRSGLVGRRVEVDRDEVRLVVAVVERVVEYQIGLVEVRLVEEVRPRPPSSPLPTAPPPALPSSTLRHRFPRPADPRRRARARRREGLAMLRRSPRALALWAGRAGRRRRHRRGRRLRPRGHSTGGPAMLGPERAGRGRHPRPRRRRHPRARRPRRAPRAPVATPARCTSPTSTHARARTVVTCRCSAAGSSPTATSRRGTAPASTASCPRACARSGSTVSRRARPARRRSGRRARELRLALDRRHGTARDTVVVAAGVARARHRHARRRDGTGRSGAGSRCSSTAIEAERLADAQANGVLTLALVPPEEMSGVGSIGAHAAVHSIHPVVDPPRHHPRDRAGPLGVPSHLVERPPPPRPRALRVGTSFTDNESLEKSFDVALHVGTLIAVLWYFRRDLAHYVVAALHSIRVAPSTTSTPGSPGSCCCRQSRARSSAPLLAGVIEDELGDPILIGINLIVFALRARVGRPGARRARGRRLPPARRGDHGRRTGAGARRRACHARG